MSQDSIIGIYSWCIGCKYDIRLVENIEFCQIDELHSVYYIIDNLLKLLEFNKNKNCVLK